MLNNKERAGFWVGAFSTSIGFAIISFLEQSKKLCNVGITFSVICFILSLYYFWKSEEEE